MGYNTVFILTNRNMKIKIYTILFFIFTFNFLIAQSNFKKAEVSAKTSTTEISIFPNPTNEVFKISTESKINKIEIYNLIGKKIKTIKNDKSNTFNVSDLRIGIYLIRIFDSNNRVLKVVRLGVNNQIP